MKFFIGVCLLLANLLLGAAEPFTSNDVGRLLCLNRPVAGTPAGSFLVVERLDSPQEIRCRVYGGTATVTVQPGEVAKLVFFEGANAFAITQYALYNYAFDRPDDDSVRLARIAGDDTGRMAVINEFEAVRNQFLQAVQSAIAKRSAESLTPEEYEDQIRTLLDESTAFDTVKRAAINNDLVLAIALAQSWFDTVRRHAARLFVTPAGRTAGMAALGKQQGYVLELYRERSKLANVRRDQFRQLCPQARGLWCEAPPASYEQMLQVFDRSLRAYARLDELSQITDFQDWGSAMLDTLLLVESSPGSKALEEEFDRAIKEEQKRRKP